MNNRIEFLRTVTPFNLLSEDILRGTAELLQEITYHQDTLIYQQEVTRMKGVDIIAEGEYESFFYDSAQNKRLIEIHPKGFCYGGVSILLNRKQSLRTAIAKKGTVVYFLPRKHFRSLCKANDDFFHYFTADFGIRMQNEEFAHFFKRPASFEESFIASDQLYSQKLESIEQRAIVSCNENTPIFEAAKVMAQNKVSCLFVRNDLQSITGFITDITLRDNVVAAQADVKQPIKNIMDPNIRSIHADAYVYEATLLMFSTKARYLLIEKNGEYIAFISRNKLLSEQTQSPMVFIQSVKLAVSVSELKKKWQSVPRVVYQLLERGVHAEIVNQVITSVADIIALKVIEAIIKKMGEPPARFVFMVLGSEGRKEQTLKTDQDNAIIYEDKANEHREEARAYFLDFAKQVSDQLNNIGFSYCTGGFMAQNPKWTHSLSHWKRNYESWMIESVPETVIKFSTFFDCRYIYGDRAIIDELKTFLDKELQKPNETLFFHMATNALQYEPPLTFFNNIKTFTKGSQEVFDVKKAMTPIVDMVRVYALKNRIFEVNTGDRIKALKEKGVFTEKSYQELMQAYYLLMRMRLIKQANQIINDKAAPDNYVNLNNFTKIEQLTLKAIFKTIANFQTGLKIAFTSNLFG